MAAASPARPSIPELEETEDSDAQKAVNALVDALTSGLSVKGAEIMGHWGGVIVYH